MTAIRGLRIPANISLPIEAVQVSELAEYQAVVGGDIEVVEADVFGLSIYLNETGRLDGLGINERATVLTARLRHPIVGDVLVLGPIDSDGDDTDLSDEHKNFILAAAGA